MTVNSKLFGPNLRLTLNLLCVIAITVGTTVIQGRSTSRWGTPREMEEVTEFVRNVPTELGRWKSVGDATPLAPEVRSELGVIDYVSRNYSDGDKEITLLLMAGHTSSLVRHPPDICYGALGNTYLSEPAPVALPVHGKDHQFRLLPIRPQAADKGDFVVVYGFAYDGIFDAPTSPRMRYHGIPAILKIQILSSPDSEDPTTLPEPSRDFLTALCEYYATAFRGDSASQTPREARLENGKSPLTISTTLGGQTPFPDRP